jgi:three-Cys-motif partner protein
MRKKARDTSTHDLFPDLLSPDKVEELVTLRPLRHPVWSHQKARLIEKYLYFFVMVTKHGTYIDGFAGPQEPDKPETWSAKRVLESTPRYLRHFYLCELDGKKVEALRQLRDQQPSREKNEPKRECEVVPGDFNVTIEKVLSCGVITDKEATFALLDQRTFECHWATVKKLAGHKKAGHKIELFYFLAVKWLHRALAGTVKNTDVVDAWWGNDKWRELHDLKQAQIPGVMTSRIKDELGYRFALPYPIYEREKGGGSIMYYMIHATDHPDAPGLMWRAYDQAIMPLEPPPEQGAISYTYRD